MTTMPKLVVLGRQGAGKGTQGQRLARHLSIAHVATGDVLRKAVRQGTRLGVAAQRYMDAGELVPDEIMLGLVLTELDRPEVARVGWVLDGFPRTLAQGLALTRRRGDDAVDAAVDIDVSTDVVLHRLARRRVCVVCGGITTADVEVEEVPCVIAGCRGLARPRADDTPDAIRRRLEVYDEQTRPLVDWFSASGRLVSVDGAGEPDAVFGRLTVALAPVLWGKGLAVG